MGRRATNGSGCWVLLGVIALSGCGTDHYDTVEAIQVDPESYEGQRVRVRGWAHLEVTSTLALCEPVTCDCNATDGQLMLSDHPSERSHVPFEVEGQYGEGNDCGFTIPLFDPSARAYELVGTVTLEEWLVNGPPKVVLVDLDLDASRALHGDSDLDELDASPLALGPHACGCPGGMLEACAYDGSALVCQPG